jgi:hypothetical protein
MSRRNSLFLKVKLTLASCYIGVDLNIMMKGRCREITVYAWNCEVNLWVIICCPFIMFSPKSSAQKIIHYWKLKNCLLKHCYMEEKYYHRVFNFDKILVIFRRLLNVQFLNLSIFKYAIYWFLVGFQAVGISNMPLETVILITFSFITCYSSFP